MQPSKSKAGPSSVGGVSRASGKGKPRTSSSSPPPRSQRQSSQSADKYTGAPPTSWDPTLDRDDVTWSGPLELDLARRMAYRAQMERWLSDPFTLDERWRARAKQELNEEPLRLHDEVAALRGLVAAVPGLRSRMDDHFLLAFLRSKRHDVDAALSSLMKYYRMRKLNPAYFELCLPSTHPEIYSLKAINMLEGWDNLGRPVCYFTADFHPNSITSFEFVRLIIHLLDFLVIDPRAQVSGLTILVNLEKQCLAHTRMITVKFLKLMLQIFQGSFPVRMKQIFLCHGSLLFRATFAVLRPFIPDKFKERIHILGSEVDSVANYIPPTVLPPELLGLAPPVRPDVLSERISLVEDLIKEWQEYGFDEGAEMTRMPSMQFDDDEPPLPITDKELQRRLTVDALAESLSEPEIREGSKAGKKAGSKTASSKRKTR